MSVQEELDRLRDAHRRTALAVVCQHLGDDPSHRALNVEFVTLVVSKALAVCRTAVDARRELRGAHACESARVPVA